MTPSASYINGQHCSIAHPLSTHLSWHLLLRISTGSIVR